MKLNPGALLLSLAAAVAAVDALVILKACPWSEEQDAFRAAHLIASFLSASPMVPIPAGIFTLTLAVGDPDEYDDTPRYTREVVFDTGSSWTWIINSFSEVPYSCGNVLYSYIPYPYCVNDHSNFLIRYLDGTVCSGEVVIDAINFYGSADGIMSDFLFGAANQSVNAGVLKRHYEGVLGFGMAPLSFPKQKGLTRFGYCLNSTAGVLFLGDDAVLGPVLRVYHSPFLSNDAHYVTQLTGIRIGNTLIKVSTTLLFDSGTSDTHLMPALFDVVKRVFDDMFEAAGFQEDASHPFCYEHSDQSFRDIKPITFYIGDPFEVSYQYYANIQFGVRACVRISDANIMGAAMQVGYMVVYDLERSRLSFARANCPNTE